MPLRSDIKKVLVIGSGPIVIGQAAEFDYAGTQACRALKQEGLEVVLINSNPATIMTDKHMADKIYIEPLTLDVVKRVIEIEKPDSVLSNLGGQTGLTLSMELAECGFLAEHNVKLLGSNPETIHKAEDRQAFKDTMEKIGQPCIPSKVVETVEDAMDFAEVIHYPVIVRPAFTLGGAAAVSRDPRGAPRDSHQRTSPFAYHTDSGREVHLRLEGDRIRGNARQQGQRYHRLLHGELRPGRRSHRRLHRCRSLRNARR